MKKTFALILTVLSFSVSAGVSDEVFIRGKIGNDFNDRKVKVVDTYGQTYYLARKLFPKDFKFRQGESFAIEVHEKEIAKVKMLKK